MQILFSVSYLFIDFLFQFHSVNVNISIPLQPLNEQINELSDLERMFFLFVLLNK